MRNKVVIVIIAILVVLLVVKLYPQEQPVGAFLARSANEKGVGAGRTHPTQVPNVSAEQSKATSCSPAEVNAMIKQYIEENPVAIMQSIENHYAKKAMEAKTMQSNKISQLHDAIYHSMYHPKIGSTKPKLQIVEFFDYQCKFCQGMLAIHQKLLTEYPDIQIILINIPIMGEWSVKASKASLAVNIAYHEKYYAFHEKLLSLQERTEAGIMKVAAELGIESAKLQEAMAKDEIEDIMQENLRIAKSLSIRGTPAYIIADNLIPGAIGYSEMKNALEAADLKKQQHH